MIKELYVIKIYRLIIRGVLTISLLLIFFNDVLIYYIHQLSWKQIKCPYGLYKCFTILFFINLFISFQKGNCTRILFIADPQLLGKTYDRSMYSSFARYDADR